MGQTPGELHKSKKIAMLEKKVPVEVFPWQILNEKCAKSFRKEIHKKAKKRFRRSGKHLEQSHNGNC